MSDTGIVVSIKVPGELPEHHENLRQFISVLIPSENPESGSKLRLAGMAPEAVISTGLWLIQAGACMRDKKPLPPFGHVEKAPQQIGNRPGKIVAPPQGFNPG